MVILWCGYSIILFKNLNNYIKIVVNNYIYYIGFKFYYYCIYIVGY